MELKYALLLTSVTLFMGIFMVPSIYSMFSGQHSFSEESNCLKCHGDIREELDSSSYHISLTCRDCHINSESHNSSLHGNVIKPMCLDCHSQEENDINNNKDSHKPFVQEANLNSLMKGDNEACILCHTTKSINFEILYADTYQLDALRIEDGWKVSGISKIMINNIPVNVRYNGTAGVHRFPPLEEFRCEKCHAKERDQLDNSNFHKDISCGTCHRFEKSEKSGYHSAEVPSCLDCHVYNPDVGKDAHTSLKSSGEKSGEKNAACSSCHSTFNNKINFIKPDSLEWDIRNDNGSWLVEKLKIGEDKTIEIYKNLSGNLHDISLDGDCDSCHKDIKDAVKSGGHSGKGDHNYKDFSDMNTYCISCHSPLTKDQLGDNIHAAIKISCIDCHGKSLSVDIKRNGNMEQPPYDSNEMGGVEKSISDQPYYVQSYICVACKNSGNPIPENGSTLHFKILTEPDVDIYINGAKKFP